MRPEIMKEFERASELSLLSLTEHKNGGRVAGVYCLLPPRNECGRREQSGESLRQEGSSIAAAKRHADHLCPLIKSTTDMPSRIAALLWCSDFILGETPATARRRCSS